MNDNAFPFSANEANAIFRLFSRGNPSRPPSAPSEAEMAQRVVAVAWAIALARYDFLELCALTVTRSSISRFTRAAAGAAGSGRQHATDRGGEIWNVLRDLRKRGVDAIFAAGEGDRTGKHWMRAYNVDPEAFVRLVDAVFANINAADAPSRGEEYVPLPNDGDRLRELAQPVVAAMRWTRFSPPHRCARLARKRAIVTDGERTASYFDVTLRSSHPLAQVEPLLPLVVDVAVWRMEPEDRLMIEEGGDIVIDVAKRAFTVALGDVEMTIPFIEKAPGYEPTPSMAISYAQRIPVEGMRTLFVSPLASNRDIEEAEAYARSCHDPGWTIGNCFAVYVDQRSMQRGAGR